MGLAFPVFQQRNSGNAYSGAGVSKPSGQDSLAFLAVSDPPTSLEDLLAFGRQLHRAEMQRLKMRHRTGLGGGEVVLLRSQLMDQLVIWSYQAVLKESAVKSPI